MDKKYISSSLSVLFPDLRPAPAPRLPGPFGGIPLPLMISTFSPCVNWFPPSALLPAAPSFFPQTFTKYWGYGMMIANCIYKTTLNRRCLLGEMQEGSVQCYEISLRM